MSPKISEEQKEQRKQQIIDAAHRVFIRKGYEQATLKDIVEEAEMSRGWIYLYFQTKEEIFIELMEQQEGEDERALAARLADAPTVWAAIEAIFFQQKADIGQLHSSAAPAFYEYFIAGWREEERRALLIKRYDQSVASLVQLFGEGVSSGEFVPHMPLELIAKMASAQIEGIMAHVLGVGAERVDISQQIDGLLAFLKYALGVRV